MDLNTVFPPEITSLPISYRGKVRDIYELDDRHMLIVTSDRISAFDVILPSTIPDKGVVLTSVSNFWFNRFSQNISNHLVDMDLANILTASELAAIEGRYIVVRKLKALPVEAIVRGYIIGSGWKDYQNTGQVCGISLPSGLKQAEKLPQPLFTPSTKAAVGDHDININFDETVDLIGVELAKQIRDVSIDIYRKAADYAIEKGIIIADTKFEFGLDENENLVLIDEILTPDSSRFWPVESYQTGISPPSFDKQYVRDYLETLDWDKTDPGPELPESVIENTAEKYQEARRKLISE